MSAPIPQNPTPALKAGFLVLIGLMVWACGQTETSRNFDSWIPFTSEEAGFSVSTPAVFAKNTESTLTDAGDITLIRFTAQPDIHHIYIIVANQIPAELMVGRDPHQMLQGAREGVIEQFQGTITAERQLTLGGKAGLELKQNGTSQGLNVAVISRIYLAGTGMFQVHVISEKGYEDPDAFRQFLDSFQLK